MCTFSQIFNYVVNQGIFKLIDIIYQTLKIYFLMKITYDYLVIS